MKIFMLLALGSFAVNAQDLGKNEVPTAVTSAFENAYSAASDVEWEKSAENFNVEFDLDKMDHEIWYSPAGEVLKMEKEITENDLPAAIKSALKSNYSGFQVEDAEMIKEGNTTTYRVELDKGNEEKDVLFDDAGKVINEWAD